MGGDAPQRRTTPVAVRLCGKVAVEVDGRPAEAAVRGRQGRLLLAYLVLHRGRAVSRDELLDALWPQAPPSDPAAALSVLLSRLRSALGQDALAGRTTLELTFPPEAWVDVEVAAERLAGAERALAAGDAPAAQTAARDAAALLANELLPAHDAEWLTVERERLADRRVRAHEVLAEAGLAAGKDALPAAEEAARRAVEAAPLRERATVLLMRVQAARGNPAQALEAYERLRRRLMDELGTAPGPEAREAHEKILRAGAPPAPSRAPLPPALRGHADRRLVGRQAELERMERELASGEGGPRLVALTGEAGIGKTRLAVELARRAHARGLDVVYGRCDPEQIVPYAPFVDALRPRVAALPAGRVERAARRGGALLGHLVPEIEERLGPLPPVGDDPDLARYRLFEAVVALLEPPPGTPETLLVLDDLHWADLPTVVLLGHVLRSAGEGIAVVAAYRESEVSEAVRDTVAETARVTAVHTEALHGLAPADVAALVADVAPDDVAADLAPSIHARTAGNPFFTIELARHLAETDAGLNLPESVRGVVRSRVARLPGDARDTLAVASVAGPEPELAVVEAAGGGEGVAAALDAAVAAGLLTEPGGRAGRYAFAHAIVRDALYEDLTARRRAELHARVGEALEAGLTRAGTGSWAEVARHLDAARPLVPAARVVEVMTRAAQAATEVLAWEDAVALHERALAVAEAEEASLTPAERCEHLLAIGEALRRSERVAESREVLGQAAEVARAAGHRTLLARVALGYGGSWFESGFVDPTLVVVLEEALDGLGDEDPALRAELLGRLAMALYWSQADFERRAALTAEAVDIAEELGDPHVLLSALSAEHYALRRPENPEPRVDTARRMLDLARRVGDRDRELQARYFLVIEYLEIGDLDGADRELERYGELAAELRLPMHQSFQKRLAGTRAVLEQRLDEAEQLIMEAMVAEARVQPEVAVLRTASQMFWVRRDQGRLGELEEPARQMLEQFPLITAWRTGLAAILFETGRHEEAAREFAALAPDGFAALAHEPNWQIGITLLSHLSAGGIGTDEDAQALYDRLIPVAARVAVAAEAVGSSGPVALYLGLLARRLGRLDDAERHLRYAVDLAGRIRAWGYRDRAAQALAELEAARAAPSPGRGF